MAYLVHHIDSSSHRMFRGCMVVAVAMQILTDVLSFIVWFNEDVGYAAHVGGFCTGLLVGLATIKVEKYRCWKTIVSLLSFVAVVTLLGLAVRQHESVWPPKPIIRPFWSPIDDMPCCAEYYELSSAGADQDDDVKNSYYCNGLDLIHYD